MVKKFRSIILRTVKYSDTSLIIEMLTKEAGLQSFIVSGVKGGRSKQKPAFFQIGMMLEVVGYHKEGGGLSRIKEVRPYYVYERMPYDISRSAVMQFIVELLRHTIREPEPNEPLYDFVDETMKVIDNASEGLRNVPLRFAWQLMDHLGIRPDISGYPDASYFDLRDGSFSSMAPGHLDYIQEKYIHWIFELLANIDLMAEIPGLGRIDRSHLMSQTQQYFRWHIENFNDLKSPSILEAVFRK